MTVVVISYNTRDMTLECLASLYAQTQAPIEVIVVDNASTDGSAEAIAQAFPQVRLLAETRNHGFAPAHELALPLARGRWLLLLNPDTVVLDGAIDHLLAFAQRTPQAMIWGGRTLYPDRSLNPYSCWRRMTLWSLLCRASGLTGLFPRSALFNSEAYGGWDRGSARQVDIVTGCLLLIERAFWARLGGFDRAFTMYGEEADLCLRARALGARPMITPEATIIHYGGASETVRTDKMVRLLKAKRELIRRHFGPVSRPLAAGLLAVWPLGRAVLLGAAASVTGRGGLRARANGWWDIWRRRDEWSAGYSNRAREQSQ